MLFITGHACTNQKSQPQWKPTFAGTVSQLMPWITGWMASTSILLLYHFWTLLSSHRSTFWSKVCWNTSPHMRKRFLWQLQGSSVIWSHH